MAYHYRMSNTINKKWHEKHIVPMSSTLKQRVAWHVAHLKHCGCRKDVPKTIIEALKAEGKKVCNNGHVYKDADSCPVCLKNVL